MTYQLLIRSARRHLWFSVATAVMTVATTAVAQPAPPAVEPTPDQAPAEPGVSAAAAEDDEDVEVDVHAGDPAPTPAPTPEPTPTLTPEPELAAEPSPAAEAAEQAEATAEADASTTGVAGLAGMSAATAPAGESSQPRSLIAEGSNYVRPLRRGLNWWGFVQVQYTQNQLSEDQLAQGGEPLNLDQFTLRRARLRIDRGWEYAAATFEIDASSVNGLNVGLRRAEASFLYRGTEDDSITPLLVLTAGVTDLPFGAEIGESQRDRVFMERSIGSLALFPTEADVGVKLWGAYRFINYAVAALNGQPLNPQQPFDVDPNAAKDIAGRVGTAADISEKLYLEGGVSFYTGSGFSPGRDATKDTIQWVDDNFNNFSEAHEFQGVTGSAATPSENFDRWALGLDLGFALTTGLGVSRLNGEVVLAENLDRGVLVSNPVLAGSDLRQTVLAVSVVQQVTDYGLLGFRVAHYDPNSDLIEQRAGEFHLRQQDYWVLSPVAGVTLPTGRIVAQYDLISDYLGRDTRGVPTDAKNNQLTIRLQVDL